MFFKILCLALIGVAFAQDNNSTWEASICDVLTSYQSRITDRVLEYLPYVGYLVDELLLSHDPSQLQSLCIQQLKNLRGQLCDALPASD